MASSSPKSNPTGHAPPLIFAPAQSHKTTLIILHGRGSTAQTFAEPLLQHPVSPLLNTSTVSQSFQSHFPNTKFIFPTAPLRRAVVFNRSLTHQWFDNWSLTQPEVKQHLQIQGLRETARYLHGLLREEIELLDGKAGRVVLMGLSQGCAASLIAALLLETEDGRDLGLGGVVGMCGYLPFRSAMADAVETGDGDDEDGDDDMFEREEEVADQTKFEKAVEWLKEELEFSSGSAGELHSSRKDPCAKKALGIKVFLGHGVSDEKVPYQFGKLAAEFLTSVDAEVAWREYEGLGHWYSAEMLRDAVSFLKGLEGWD